MTDFPDGSRLQNEAVLLHAQDLILAQASIDAVLVLTESFIESICLSVERREANQQSGILRLNGRELLTQIRERAI